jgi:hypothetical protein
MRGARTGPPEKRRPAALAGAHRSGDQQKSSGRKNSAAVAAVKPVYARARYCPVPFSFYPDRIEIRLHRTHGLPLFAVIALEPNGGRLNVWRGRPYDAAIRMAEETRASFDLDTPVISLVAGAA